MAWLDCFQLQLHVRISRRRDHVHLLLIPQGRCPWGSLRDQAMMAETTLQSKTIPEMIVRAGFSPSTESASSSLRRRRNAAWFEGFHQLGSIHLENEAHRDLMSLISSKIFSHEWCSYMGIHAVPGTVVTRHIRSCDGICSFISFHQFGNNVADR
jgi:hypothetical protein